MKCLCTNLPRLRAELGDAEYASVIKQLQYKLEEKGTSHEELTACGDEEAAGMLDVAAAQCEGELLVLTDSSLVAQYCARQSIPYGVVLCFANQCDSFPQGADCMECLQDINYDYLKKIYQRGKGLPWTIVETKRLQVREITVADVTRLFELYADEEITAYMEPLFPTMEEEEEYTRKYIENVYHFYRYGMWVLVEKTSGLIIGRAGFEYHDDFEGLELGFMLGKAYWHEGYAYEACQAILAYAREELEMHEFRARVHFQNAASRRLCERLGFVECGTVDIDDVCHIDYRM